MKKLLPLLMLLAFVASCKDSEDEVQFAPATQEILANGLLVPSEGIDTTVVFPLAGKSAVAVNYDADNPEWYTITGESLSGRLNLHVKCQPSTTDLTERVKKVYVTIDGKTYEMSIRQAPRAQAYADTTVYYMPNDGGELTIPIHANTTFNAEIARQVVGYGDSAKAVKVSWVRIKGDTKGLRADKDNVYNLQFEGKINTGLGRRASVCIDGDSLSHDGYWIRIQQEPRQLNAKETIEGKGLVSAIDVLLGHDKANLSRVKSLTVSRYLAVYDLDYLSGMYNYTLDTLDLSGSDILKESGTVGLAIKSRQFFKSNLTKIALPKNVEAIGDEAFALSPNLKEIVIPSSANLQSVGTNAFYGLDGCAIHVGWATPPVLDGTFYAKGLTLYVPRGTADAYKASKYWNQFDRIVEE